jgi:glycosyltransferase involved in cell wall biosynthesis
VPRLLRAFDVFATFSRSEGHPLAVLEAMATGLPVVATAVGGVPGVIAGEESAPHGVLAAEDRAGAAAGVLVASDNEAELAAALAALTVDRARMAALGGRARAVVEARYGIERMVDDYMGLYAACARRREARLGKSVVPAAGDPPSSSNHSAMRV